MAPVSKYGGKPITPDTGKGSSFSTFCQIVPGVAADVRYVKALTAAKSNFRSAPVNGHRQTVSQVHHQL